MNESSPETSRPGQADPPAAPHAAATRSPWVPMLLGWLLPGAGHAAIGRRWPAVFVAGAILPLFIGGMMLAGSVNVNPKAYPWMFAAQVFAGGPAFAASALTADTVIARFHPYQSAGELYTAIAGLLNLVAIADVWARCRHGDPVMPRAGEMPEADDDGTPDPRDVLAAGSGGRPAPGDAHA